MTKETYSWEGLFRGHFAGCRLSVALLLAVAMGTSAFAGNDDDRRKVLPIKEQGSLAAGAKVLKNPGEDGGEFHYDYLYAFYQIPANAAKNSLVMWHGCLGRAWERRPDGGEGFQSKMVRHGFPVFVIDSPRLSRGARGLGAYSVDAVTSGDDCGWNSFRYGRWSPPAKRTFFPGVQLARDPKSVADLCELSGSPGGPSLGYPGTPETRAVWTDAVLDLIAKKSGDTVLMTHSASGIYGFEAAMRTNKIKGIIAYEPAGFAFPSDGVPPVIVTPDFIGDIVQRPFVVSPQEFRKLTKIPIQIVFGDNISFSDQPVAQNEEWRILQIRAKQFANAVNSRGGNVEVLFLPKIGVRGNTHFPFFDLNNQKIADLAADFLKRKGLARKNDHDDDDHHHGYGQ